MDPQVSTPHLSSPKLSASPMVGSSSMKITDTTSLPPLDTTPVASSSSSSSSDQRIARLERDLQISMARNEHLQRSLADARRSCRDSEQLLLRLQWDPKDDYYCYINPAKTDSKFLDKQELKVKALLDQMRIMETTIEDLRAENSELKGHEDDEEIDVDAQGEEKTVSSPAANSPFTKKQRVKSPLAGSSSSPAISSWSRSPSASPAASPNPNGKSPRFWLFRKLTPVNSPSFWRGNSASTDSPVASPASTRPTLSRGRPSTSDLEVGGTPLSPTHDVASPAISAYSSKRTALRQAA